MLPLWVRVDLGAIAMKGFLHIPQISKAGASPSDGLVSYLGHNNVGKYRENKQVKRQYHMHTLYDTIHVQYLYLLYKNYIYIHIRIGLMIA